MGVYGLQAGLKGVSTLTLGKRVIEGQPKLLVELGACPASLIFLTVVEETQGRPRPLFW